MTNLLSAEFSRLLKSKVFRVLASLSFAGGALFELIIYFSCKAVNLPTYVDQGMFAFLFFASGITAILISLFTGTEHAEKTVRNKLIMGHSRTSVYLSKVFVNYIGSLLLFVAYLAGIFGVGVPVNHLFQYTAADILFSIGLGCTLLLTYTALFTAMAMCWDNKAGNAVTSLVLCVVLLFAASYLSSALREPKMYPGERVIMQDGRMIQESEEENPNYLEGTKRRIYQIIYDALPAGQGMEISGFTAAPHAEGAYAAYDVAEAILLTAAGAYLFRKKDLS